MSGLLSIRCLSRHHYRGRHRGGNKRRDDDKQRGPQLVPSKTVPCADVSAWTMSRHVRLSDRCLARVSRRLLPDSDVTSTVHLGGGSATAAGRAPNGEPW